MRTRTRKHTAGELCASAHAAANACPTRWCPALDRLLASGGSVTAHRRSRGGGPFHLQVQPSVAHPLSRTQPTEGGSSVHRGDAEQMRPVARGVTSVDANPASRLDQRTWTIGHTPLAGLALPSWSAPRCTFSALSPRRLRASLSQLCTQGWASRASRASLSVADARPNID